MSVGRNCIRAVTVSVTLIAAGGVFGVAPASATCPGVGVHVGDGDIGVCTDGAVPNLESHDVPYDVGSICVGSLCTPEQAGSIPLILPGDSTAPSTYCTSTLLCPPMYG